MNNSMLQQFKTAVSGAQILFVAFGAIVLVQTESVDPHAVSEDLIELNPYGTVPTLVDRDLVLFSSRIIMEYLDERFPHPPLMPVYPVARGKSRLLMLRIEQDWYPTLSKAETGSENERVEALKQLKEEILAVSAIFTQTPYFIVKSLVWSIVILHLYCGECKSLALSLVEPVVKRLKLI